MPRKIVFFMGAMGRGGSERVVSILSRFYCELGWSVDICMLLHGTNDYLLDERVNVIDISNEDSKNKILRTIKIIKDIRRYFVIKSPDVVVPFLAKISAIVWIATFGKKDKNFRVVASERIDPYEVNYSKLLRAVVNRSFEESDAIVFQTKRAKGFYSKSIQAKGSIIGNPVTMKHERAEKPDNVIINAGRLEPQKNQKMLINAFAKIAEKFPYYSLHIYGEGSLRSNLEKQIKELQLEDRIILKGNTLNYQKSLTIGEIFVLSSNYEGLSNALLEAMTLGIPCISTNCAGSDEIIIDGDNGILIPVDNSDELANAMEKLLEDKAMQRKIRKKAKKSTKKFETNNVINDWREVLEEKDEENN